MEVSVHLNQQCKRSAQLKLQASYNLQYFGANYLLIIIGLSIYAVYVLYGYPFV